MNPLTHLLGAKTLEQFVGQKHIIGRDKPLHRLIKKGEVPHLFFYGKPGTGKTTLVRVIANELQSEFHPFNATTLKIDDLRKVFKSSQNTLFKPIIFIDEIHRLSKNQQEVLLPHMENSKLLIIGASTENPYYTLTAAIRSRGFIFEFLPHTREDLEILLENALDILEGVSVTKDAKEYLLRSSIGDARSLLNLLDFASKVDSHITLTLLSDLKIDCVKDGMSSKDSHYDLASAMIKSIRGSDIDASLYYLARLIDGGEHIDFITRRLVISASEDIGNSNPNALNLAVNVQIAAKEIGYPEARILLSQCVVYLASSPKSNSSYCAINKALSQINKGKILPIPENIKDKAIGYLYPHDFGGWCKQQYLHEELSLYKGSGIGFEKTLQEWQIKIKGEK